MEPRAGMIREDKLADLAGLTTRRLRQLADDGYFSPPAGGEYQFAPTLRGLFKYYQQGPGDKRLAMSAEKLRKLREEADKLALENERTRGNLVEIEAVYKHFEGIFVAFRQRVLGSSLTEEEKDEFLRDLRRLKARDIAKPDSSEDDSRKAIQDPGAAASDKLPGMG